MAMIAVHRSENGDPVDNRQSKEVAERIVDAAVEMAELRGWEGVELTEVAARLGIPPEHILDHYRDLDAVANAWFLRGWHAMLADKPEEFVHWPAWRRIDYCILAWFDAFAEHRHVTIQMLRTKAHLPHLHTWVPMVFDLSRTIQWLREAARLEAPYGTRQAQMEEIGLTAVFLVTLKVWSRDDSPAQRDTRRYLGRHLKRSECLMDWLWHGHQAR